LETIVAEGVPNFVKGDPTRLLQVLNNLVGNAIKFTDHGKVTLQVKVGAHVGETQILLVIEVKDTGIGIPSDKMKEIFEPFLQADVEINRVYGGTGLGLSIVKNLVEIQGGSIEVESVENKGTTFRLFLTYERGIEVQEDRKAEEKKSLSPLSVLYVEDVLTNQLLMKRICSRWDVKISMASNGYEGLKKAKTKQHDIILIDLRMTGADGFDTARKIRKMEGDYFKKVPVIAVTAASLEENIERIRQAGMDDAIAKPISQNRLYEIFKKYGKADRLNASRHKASQTYKVNGKKIFEHLDMIFQKDQKGYRKTLLAIRKEFNNYKEKLKTAIVEVDENEVSNIRHKIAGTSFILEHKSFYAFLKSLKNLHELSDHKLKLLLHEIDRGFDELIEEFDKKIKSLEGENNL
jgi:CheY-like chemotaxis protein